MSTPAAPHRTGPIAWLLIQPIRFYQRFISRYTPPTCRYYPTCSAFAVTALRTHGSVKGTALTVWRLLRCNPWSAGGIDHVPERGQWRGRRTVLVDDAARVDDAVRSDDAVFVDDAVRADGTAFPDRVRFLGRAPALDRTGRAANPAADLPAQTCPTAQPRSNAA